MTPKPKMRSLTALCLALTLILGCTVSDQAPAQTKVFYAGLGYLGSYEFIEANYSQALRLNSNKSGPGRMDQALQAALEAKPPQNFQLDYGLADLQRSESLVMSIAIDKEQVSIERHSIAGRPLTKLIVDASAQILFYDFESQSLVANYPHAQAINHVVEDSSQLDVEIAKLFETLYFGDASTKGLIETVVERVNTMRVDDIRGLRYQLREVTIGDEAGQQIPKGQQLAQVGQYWGQFFSAQLASKTTVPVLPYVRGYAIGNQMTGRFANGKVFNLQFPEPDFVFDIKVNKLIKSKDNKGLLYGAQANLHLLEPSLNRTLIQDDFRYGVYKLDEGTSDNLDDWAAFEDAMENLMIEWVEQLRDPKRRWFSSHARNTNDTYTTFRDKKELFND